MFFTSKVSLALFSKERTQSQRALGLFNIKDIDTTHRKGKLGQRNCESLPAEAESGFSFHFP